MERIATNVRDGARESLEDDRRLGRDAGLVLGEFADDPFLGLVDALLPIVPVDLAIAVRRGGLREVACVRSPDRACGTRVVRGDVCHARVMDLREGGRTETVCATAVAQRA